MCRTRNLRRRHPYTAVAVVALLGLLASACGGDDGATVRDLGAEADAAPASASGSGSGSASAPAVDAGATPGDGGYEYASDVSSHRLVVEDICTVKELLDAEEIDFAAIESIYRDGEASVNSDGSVRSIGGFAARDDRLHGLSEFYGTPTPLDDFVTEALQGTGRFAEENDAVRDQAVEKGIQNQVMVAWVIHELTTAAEKAAAGDFDVASGAVHNWDEAWAFYHGSAPGCSPHATAQSRAANFNTMGADSTAALANQIILDAMIAGREALLNADADTASEARARILRALGMTYSQAAIRYAAVVEDDLAAGDLAAAEKHQAEGLAFWRVLQPLAVPGGADGDTIDSIYDLAAEPGANGGEAEVRAALQPYWDSAGIAADEIGDLG